MSDSLDAHQIQRLETAIKAAEDFGGCNYATCVVGMLMTPEHRDLLADSDLPVTANSPSDLGIAESDYWPMLTELHGYPLRLLRRLQVRWDDKEHGTEETAREDMHDILQAWILEHGNTP